MSVKWWATGSRRMCRTKVGLVPCEAVHVRVRQHNRLCYTHNQKRLSTYESLSPGRHDSWPDS